MANLDSGPPAADPEIPPDDHNQPPILGVAEISGLLKRTVEETFGLVRVRGEISRPNVAASGHCYLRLKDENAVLDGVIWRGTMQRLSFTPEEGLEVVCTGRLTTYAGRSTYQIVIERMDVAGEGALLKMIEDRRRKLAEEGLFDDAAKQDLPFLPEVIGVITSPTGAVIQDILHRLADRFPRHVLLWPVTVQGKKAPGEIVAAIEGFNRLTPGGDVPRPDLLIVARGGGSLEDLMAFNEEPVVRAAAASTIPLIAAIGHETDVTLIDHAADMRAPTPTAAAEMAVPVRTELMAQVAEDGARTIAAMARQLSEQRQIVAGLARGLPDPHRTLETAMQRLDDWSERLAPAFTRYAAERQSNVDTTSLRLPTPRIQVDRIALRLDALSERLSIDMGHFAQRLVAGGDAMDGFSGRAAIAWVKFINGAETALTAAKDLLESISYQRVLERGFAMVRGPEGPVISVAGAHPGTVVSLVFHDGSADATIDGAPDKRPPARRPRKQPKGGDTGQGSLL